MDYLISFTWATSLHKRTDSIILKLMDPMESSSLSDGNLGVLGSPMRFARGQMKATSHLFHDYSANMPPPPGEQGLANQVSAIPALDSLASSMFHLTAYACR
eukprot:6214289-Pleurochrysis_carterae.AAC.3